jgi:hypothetical protein
MKSREFRTHHFVALLSLTLVIAALIIQTGAAQTSIIPAETAANLALAYGRDYGTDGLVDRPTGMFGKVMRYGEAVQYIFGRPINPGDQIARMADTPVWLIVIQGQIVEHVPPAPPDIPAKDVLHGQMAVIINGITGDIVEEVLIPGQKTLPVASLTPLTPLSDTAHLAPTRLPIQTEIPLPTSTPAP